MRVTRAESSTKDGCPAGGELGDAAERVGVGERTFDLGLDDRVDVSCLSGARVADGRLALAVGSAGGVGDQLAVAADGQVADDLPYRWASLGWVRPARMSCPSPTLVGVASAWHAAVAVDGWRAASSRLACRSPRNIPDSRSDRRSVRDH